MVGIEIESRESVEVDRSKQGLRLVGMSESTPTRR